MIQEGFNGITDINFNKVNEEYFTSHADIRRLKHMMKYFHHRDTQERETTWRVQGIIKIEDLEKAFILTKSFNNIMIGTDNEGMILTFNLPKI